MILNAAHRFLASAALASALELVDQGVKRFLRETVSPTLAEVWDFLLIPACDSPGYLDDENTNSVSLVRLNLAFVLTY